MRDIDVVTISSAQWEDAAQIHSGGCYESWFKAMTELQKAIDLNAVDSAEGLTCRQQADLMRTRVNAALANLRKAAVSADSGI